MKLNGLLYLFDQQMKKSVKNNPTIARFIVKSYNDVSNKLKVIPGDKSVLERDINRLEITDHMKNKLIGLLSQKIDETQMYNLKQGKIIDELTGVLGIGKVKACSLIKSGLTNISDLNKKKYYDQLTTATKILLKYKPLRKIPHAAIKKIAPALTGFPNSHLVGSFRRKRPFSKDIDIMIVSNSPSIMDKYIKYFNSKFPDYKIYAKGPDKISLLLNVGTIKTPVYFKVDIFRTPTKSRFAMLLYSTGSRDFNIRMRARAAKQNYLLNQHGLFVRGQPNPISVKSEREYFDILKMNYIEPENR